MSKNKESVNSNLGEIPNPFRVHEHLFSSVDDSRLAIKAILRGLAGSGADDGDGYLMKGARVEFVENPVLDVEINHKERIVIFYFKKIKQGTSREIADFERQIKREVAMEYSIGADDLRSRLAFSVYRSLTPEAQRRLIEEEKKSENAKREKKK